MFSSMEVFCTRVRNMIDIINTFSQFTKLCKATENLPRLPPDGPGDETEEYGEEEEEQGNAEPAHTMSEGSVEEGKLLWWLYWPWWLS